MSEESAVKLDNVKKGLNFFKTLKKIVYWLFALLLLGAVGWVWWFFCGDVSHGQLMDAVQEESQVMQNAVHGESQAMQMKLDERFDALDKKLDVIEARLERLMNIAIGSQMPDGMKKGE